MGMFDSIYMKTKCPSCNKTTMMELQTKKGPNVLNIYKKGDKFPGRFRQIEVTGSCRTNECMLASAKYEVKNRGYVSGFSRILKGYVTCDMNDRIKDVVLYKKQKYNYGFNIINWEKGFKPNERKHYEFALKYLKVKECALFCTHFVTAMDIRDIINQMGKYDEDEIASALYSRYRIFQWVLRNGR